MTRDVVPQPVEPRGFLRRRRSGDPRPEQSVTAVATPPASVVEAPRPVAVSPVVLAGPVAVHRPEPAPRPEPAIRAESDELLRAKDTLLQAALRQCDELSTALLNERQLRQQESERLTAENELLRDALAALNADALARQQASEVTPSPAPFALVPDQRAQPVPSAELPVAPSENAEPSSPDAGSGAGRRRSARKAGPA